MAPGSECGSLQSRILVGSPDALPNSLSCVVPTSGSRIANRIGDVVSQRVCDCEKQFFPEVNMSDNSSSNVASVAIVLIVVVAAIAFYFLFNRGGNDADIKIEVPDKIEIK